MILPYEHGHEQLLLRITRNESEFETETLEPVSFVPLLPGVS